MSEDPAPSYALNETPSTGWWIAVHPLGIARDKNTVLATWYAEVKGAQWLDDLAAQDKAMVVSKTSNGRGCYVVKLCDLLPFLDAPPKLRERFEHHRYADRIAACEREAVMAVSVWDQS
jgi:hypothetical protein